MADSPRLLDSDVLHVVAKRFTRIAENMEKHRYETVEKDLESVMEILTWLGEEIAKRGGSNE